MFGILSELIRYVIFMYLVLLMAYAQRDNNVFYNNQFVANHGFNSEDVEDMVSTPLEILDFMEEVIENGLYDADEDSEGFFSEGRGYFLQEPRLRQFRMVPTSCEAADALQGTVRCVQKLNRGNKLEARLETGDYDEDWSSYTQTNMTAWLFDHSKFYASHRGKISAIFGIIMSLTD